MNWPLLIKKARLNLGESQEKFAKRFGVATNTVSRWETGAYDVQLVAIDWLLDVYLKKEVMICENCNGLGLIEVGDLPHNEAWDSVEEYRSKHSGKLPPLKGNK